MKRCWWLLAALCLVLTGCASRQKETVDFFAMDTVMTVTVYGTGARQAALDAEASVEALDRRLSIFSSISAFAQFNDSGSASLSQEDAELLSAVLDLSRKTGGVFDPTVQPVVDVWGFYGEEPAVPDAGALAQALSLVGWEHLKLDSRLLTSDLAGVKLDLGGVAKGYAAGLVARQLKDAGVQSAVLSLGGNVQVIGARPDGKDWTVAITDPFGSGQYAARLQVRDTAVVTSGPYERYFLEDGVRYHHILDPETGFPAETGLASVTVVCEDGAVADGLSTALFVMGPEKAADFWRSGEYAFDAVFILEDGTIQITPGLEGRFSSSSAFEVLVP